MLDSAPPAARQHAGQFSDAVSSGAIQQAVSHAPPALQGRLVGVADHAFVTAFNEILLIGAVVAVVGGILGVLLVRQRDFVAAPAQAEAEPAAA